MENFNNLQQNKFKFTLDRLPNVEFRVQRAAVPGVTLGSIDFPTPFTKIPTPGHMTFDDFSISFTVGENLEEYIEILDWMTEIGQPEHLGQQRPVFRDNMSAASLIILDSASTPNFNVEFTEMFPVGLSSLEFDTQIQGSQYVIATASFRYTRFKIKKIT